MSRTYKDSPRQRAIRAKRNKRRAISGRTARRNAADDRRLGRAAIALAHDEADAALPSDAASERENGGRHAR